MYLFVRSVYSPSDALLLFFAIWDGWLCYHFHIFLKWIGISYKSVFLFFQVRVIRPQFALRHYSLCVLLSHIRQKNWHDLYNLLIHFPHKQGFYLLMLLDLPECPFRY